MIPFECLLRHVVQALLHVLAVRPVEQRCGALFAQACVDARHPETLQGGGARSSTARLVPSPVRQHSLQRAAAKGLN